MQCIYTTKKESAVIHVQVSSRCWVKTTRRYEARPLSMLIIRSESREMYTSPVRTNNVTQRDACPNNSVAFVRIFCRTVVSLIFWHKGGIWSMYVVYGQNSALSDDNGMDYVFISCFRVLYTCVLEFFVGVIFPLSFWVYYPFDHGLLHAIL